MNRPGVGTTTEDSAALEVRSKAPVFVLGCPRSGTTLLYHMLLSAGNFAVYRAESNVFNLLVPGFGDLHEKRNRKRLLRQWLRSKLFRVSGLDANEISATILKDCRSGGDFLRLVMEAVASSQSVERWSDCTPDHLLYIDEIKRQIPNALVIHIIRDGRDVALSYVQQGWSHPLPWDRGKELAIAALYWEWIVRRGREAGQRLKSDYCEVFFEDLVVKPQETLARLGEFVGQELDYELIRKVGIGSVSEPNSSFLSESANKFQPVGRWKEKLKADQVAQVEELVGDLLRDLGYPIASNNSNSSTLVKRMRSTYANMFSAKLWLRNHTPLGRFTNLSRMEISAD